MKEREALLSILTRVDLPIEERARAGDELGELGDVRATAVDRVVIPGGELLFGDPPRRVHVSEVAIDRYPVTVGAYAEFVDARGYDQKKWWSRAGWAWRTRERIALPRFWGEREWAAYLVPNHPVVGVSAYEAEAYAAFRGARLPTEAEWEKAARGTEGLRYPWGNDWLDDACQRRDYGPRSTIAIGCFPRGTSPFGVLDVVGCVWQWCRDAVDAAHDRGSVDPCIDPEDYEDGTERATRGGGWNNLPWNLTTTSCNAFPPTARFSNLGFRCVAGA